ncbi:MerR family transcriptional regulator [Sphingomonas alpina]|uniref:MerR family transcriptional regulator n=1 Tax=Sphingomonas alpina TaxID=653931 RepID=A0A7H0LKM0_9SPHN|nr:MerR family transcriptional regulator [Sphingomonas alpina]QNQ10223.1 MerR family transcriptional regulator [Sphingomonas alpina]
MKIGELARAAGISTSRIRFYEEKGVIRPADRTGNGYRDYPETTLEALRMILLAQSLGLSLAEIKASAPGDGSLPSCDDARQILSARLADIDAHLARLTAMRARIVAMMDHERSSDAVIATLHRAAG